MSFSTAVTHGGNHVWVQGSAVTAAKLGDLKKATPQLLQLTRVKGQDPEVRLLLLRRLVAGKQFVTVTAELCSVSKKAFG